MIKKSFVVLLICTLVLFMFNFSFANNLNKTIKASINKNIGFLVNGERINLENGVIQYNNVNYVPIREVSALIGTNVEWNGSTQTVILSSPKNSEQPKNENKDKEISAGEGNMEMTQTTFNGYRAVNYKGAIYFSGYDYEKDAKNIGKVPWKIIESKKIFEFTDTNGKVIEVDYTNDINVISFQYNSYFHERFYIAN